VSVALASGVLDREADLTEDAELAGLGVLPWGLVSLGDMATV